MIEQHCISTARKIKSRIGIAGDSLIFPQMIIIDPRILTSVRVCRTLNDIPFAGIRNDQLPVTVGLCPHTCNQCT